MINEINLAFDNSELSLNDKKDIANRIIQEDIKYSKIVNNNQYADKQKIDKLKKQHEADKRKDKIKDGLRKTAIVVTAPIWIIPVGICMLLFLASF